jgi:hypothetical protein
VNSKAYIVYHNEVRYVDPREYPDGKVRIPLPPKCTPTFIPVTPPDKIEYQEVKCRLRYAVRRIRRIAFAGYFPGDIIEIIEQREGIPERRRLHGAEKEMKEADETLAKAISARLKFKEDLSNGAYADGQIRTEMAIKRDRATARALSAARDRMASAVRNLCGELVIYGTITDEEAHRRMSSAMVCGSEDVLTVLADCRTPNKER